MGSRPFAILGLAIAVLTFSSAHPLFAGTELHCAAAPGEAAAQARKVLAEPQDTGMTDRDRATLACLAETVAALDARIETSGRATKSTNGPIHAPQGSIITEPPASEGE